MLPRVFAKRSNSQVILTHTLTLSATLTLCYFIAALCPPELSTGPIPDIILATSITAVVLRVRSHRNDVAPANIATLESYLRIASAITIAVFAQCIWNIASGRFAADHHHEILNTACAVAGASISGFATLGVWQQARQGQIAPTSTRLTTILTSINQITAAILMAVGLNTILPAITTTFALSRFVHAIYGIDAILASLGLLMGWHKLCRSVSAQRIFSAVQLSIMLQAGAALLPFTTTISWLANALVLLVWLGYASFFTERDRSRQMRILQQSHHELQRQSIEAEDIIALQNSIALALPTRSAVLGEALAFAAFQTHADGCAIIRVTDDDALYEEAHGLLAPLLGAREPLSTSMAQICLRTESAIVSSPFNQDFRFNRDAFCELEIGSLAAIPITLSNNDRYVLAVASREVGAFALDEVRALNLVATQLLGGLRAARECEALEFAQAEQRKYSKQVEALHLIASATATDKKDQIDGALHVVLNQLNLHWAYFSRVDYETEELVVENTVSADKIAYVEVGLRTPIRGTFSERIMASRDLILIDDLQNLPHLRPSGGAWNAALAIPIYIGDNCYGILKLADSEQRLRAVAYSDAGFIRTTGDLIANAIERAKQRERLDGLAFYDTLTGLPNRVLLEDRMSQTLLAAKRRSEIFALLFLDLDGFKAVNDKFGHAAGDEVLRITAERLKTLMRASDTVARIGGDEFVIIAPNIADPNFIESLAARIIETLHYPIVLSSGNEVRVGVSIGASFYPIDETDPQLLLQLADAAMYTAKLNGKGSLRRAMPTEL